MEKSEDKGIGKQWHLGQAHMYADIFSTKIFSPSVYVVHKRALKKTTTYNTKTNMQTSMPGQHTKYETTNTEDTFWKTCLQSPDSDDVQNSHCLQVVNSSIIICWLLTGGAQSGTRVA